MKASKRRFVPSIGRDLMLAPLVVSMRLPLLASVGGSEAMLAISEKTLAFTEGMFAAQMVALKLSTQFWPEVFCGHTPSLFSSAALARFVDVALTPTSRRVKANFDRLSKRTRLN